MPGAGRPSNRQLFANPSTERNIVEYMAYGLIAVPGLLGLIFFWTALRMYLRYRRASRRASLIEDAPLCKAAELEAGLCKMRGKVVAGDELLRSPLTRTRCVFFHFTVEELRRSGRNSYWHAIISDSQAVPCALVDKTGQATLSLEGAEALMTEGNRTHSGTLQSPPPGLEEMLRKRYNFSTKGLVFNKRLRYSERVIEDGTRILVIGDVKTKKTGRGQFYKGDNPLLVTDADEEALVRLYGRVGCQSVIITSCMMFFGFIFVALSVYLGLFQLDNVRKMVRFPGPAGPQARTEPTKAERSKPSEGGAAEPTKRSTPDTRLPAPEKTDTGKSPPSENAALAAKLADLKSNKKTVRVKALQELAKMEVDEDHRKEVARALNGPLQESDSQVQGVALSAAERWATTDNRTALEKLAKGNDAALAKRAKAILDNLK
jgi:hypothetical protein